MQDLLQVACCMLRAAWLCNAIATSKRHDAATPPRLCRPSAVARQRLNSQCETVRFRSSLSLLSVTRSDGRNATGQIGCTAVTAARPQVQCSVTICPDSARRRDHRTLHRGCMLHVSCCMLCARMLVAATSDVCAPKRGRRHSARRPRASPLQRTACKMPRGDIQHATWQHTINERRTILQCCSTRRR
jgi:hypothetical protein